MQMVSHLHALDLVDAAHETGAMGTYSNHTRHPTLCRTQHSALHRQ